MHIHKNAKLMARGREKMICRMPCQTAVTVAAGFGVSLWTVRKWMSCDQQGIPEARQIEAPGPSDASTTWHSSRTILH